MDEDEGKWQCNGTSIFTTGCKSGQTDFGHHVGTAGWQRPDREGCDMDLCEKCIQWCLYCEQNGLDLGLSVEQPAADPTD